MRITLEFHWMPVVDRNAVGETIGHLQKSRGIVAKTLWRSCRGRIRLYIRGEVVCGCGFGRCQGDNDGVLHPVVGGCHDCFSWGGPGAYDAVPDSPLDRFLEDERFKGIEHDLPVIQLGPNLDWNKLWLTIWVVLLHVCVSLGSGLGIVDGMANRSYTGTS